jgi:hypothetical protein
METLNGYSVIHRDHYEQKLKPITQYFIQATSLAYRSEIQLVYHHFVQQVVCVTHFESLKRQKCV